MTPLSPTELIVDVFCGGGGASTGIVSALRRRVDVAIDHNPRAMAMHVANHPSTSHVCEDVRKVDPREVAGGRPVGLAWFSPSCTHFSRAKGTAPVSIDERGLAWVVVNWARVVRPRVIVLENVDEFAKWGPLNEDGRPILARAGETFREWLGALSDLGYAVDYRVLTASDYGVPTTRRRLFVVARRDGVPPAWPEPTHGPGRLPPRPALDVIDWSIPCPSIFARTRPLAEATLKRISEGIRRYVVEAANPFLVMLTHQGRVHDLAEPVRTVTAAHRGEIALVEPFTVPVKSHGGGGNGPRSIEDPVRTVMASKRGEFALVEPFVVRHGHYSTLTGAGLREGCGVGTFRGQSLDQPLGTVCATNDKHVVCPFVSKHYGGMVGHDLERPLGTVTSVDHHALTAPFLTKFYGTSTGALLTSPTPAVTASGTHLAIVEALAKTAPSREDRSADVRAFLVKYFGKSSVAALEKPVSTLTTKARLGLVVLRGETYAIADIGMRMLEPRELFTAQGFPRDYVIDLAYQDRRLTKTDQIAFAGNAVCPPVARAIVAANFAVTEREIFGFDRTS